jgi:hypothetical protein
MLEPWRPFVALLESFAELLTSARHSVAARSMGEQGVDSEFISTRAEQFRDALLAASEIELLSVRLYHKKRGGYYSRHSEAAVYAGCESFR